MEKRLRDIENPWNKFEEEDIYLFFSMCPGNSRAIAGIHRVENLTAGTVRDSPDDLVALEERNMMAESSEVRLTAIILIYILYRK